MNNPIKVIAPSLVLESVLYYLYDHYPNNVWYVDKEKTTIFICVKYPKNPHKKLTGKMVFITKSRKQFYYKIDDKTLGLTSGLISEDGSMINSFDDVNTAYENLIKKYFGLDNEKT